MALEVDRFFWRDPEVLKLHNYQKLTLIFFLCVPASNATEAAAFVGASPQKVVVWRQHLINVGLLPNTAPAAFSVRSFNKLEG